MLDPKVKSQSDAYLDRLKGMVVLDQQRNGGYAFCNCCGAKVGTLPATFWQDGGGIVGFHGHSLAEVKESIPARTDGWEYTDDNGKVLTFAWGYREDA